MEGGERERVSVYMYRSLYNVRFRISSDKRLLLLEVSSCRKVRKPLKS